MQDRRVRVSRLFFRLGGWIFLLPLAIAFLLANAADTESSNVGIVAVIAALVALVFLIWRANLIRSAVRTARQGAVGQARVTAHKPSADMAGKRRYRLVWEDSSGTKGRSLPMSEKQSQIHPVDSRITVYADPAGKRVWWEPDLALNPTP